MKFESEIKRDKRDILREKLKQEEYRAKEKDILYNSSKIFIVFWYFDSIG